MNRVTFEMLAKWIAKQNNAKVVFDGQATGASANCKTNEIFMPENLKEHNILAGLALLMHEAAHLRHSQKIDPNLVKGHISRNIVNVMEDIRIDHKNFDILYNIRDFYQRLITDHVHGNKDEIAKAPLMTRCLINSILWHENFDVLPDKEANDFNNKHNVYDIINQGRYNIENNRWNELKKNVQEIKDIFKIKDEDDFEIPSITIAGLIGQGEEGTEELEGKGIRPGDTPGNVGKFMQPSSAWDKGEGIKGPSKDIVGEAAFEDMTKQAFKELLNIKEKRIVFEGMKLNTEEITSFFTGDIEQLFHDEDIIKVKKSKLAFCLDGSGSMSSNLIDGSQRTETLVRTVRSIINILKDLQETEGLNISYDVWAFDYNAEKLDVNNWEREYSTHGGGTNLLESFLTVQDDILKNQEIDGSKMVILITDGEVGSGEINDLRNHIIKHGAEVRCMVVGIGASLTGRFVETIAGDNNILAQDHADSIIMDCIRTMIE